MSEKRAPGAIGGASGDSPEVAWRAFLYVPDGTEEIRVVDICDFCQRIRNFYSNPDARCEAVHPSICLAQVYKQMREAP